MTLTDLQRTEQLAEGDPCEFRHPASRRWQPGTVVLNGGSSYWHVRDAQGCSVTGLYIEHVRAPGTDPWKGLK